ncbi:MAG: citrate (Si)-synthase [Spirochaetae bacterium HGW-Spirochaetae-8]|nr:MAG: citrate (Si)-synthase [Spirochaetae bacterium HGW-Spirochaetae-8]
MEINKEFATLTLPEHVPMQIPIITDNMGAKSIDIHSLRKETGYITYDPGFVNTGSCTSSICYVNGEQGILRYRGYDIEDLVNNCDFVEVAYLLIKGELPNATERKRYAELLNKESLLHYDMQTFFRGYPQEAHPMSVLAAMSVSLSAFYPEMDEIDPELQVDFAVTRLISKIRTITAFTFRHMRGEDFVNPSYKYSYCENFLNMMFKSPVIEYQIDPLHVKALNQLLILHADHEQNCSTTAVRLIASAEANLYASISAGICALWGFKHGGANQAVIEMLENAYAQGLSAKDIVQRAKNKENPFLLMGFGHRVYKTFDPRAKIAKRLCMEIISRNGESDPLLDLAMELEEEATNDSYFKERSLYPNIDFYTGLIFRKMGIPTTMFTCMFAMGRLPGWIAHWLEWKKDPYGKIGRPRQVYSGPYVRKVQNLSDR